jgi:tetratricopeptide (TPR) repeat protein
VLEPEHEDGLAGLGETLLKFGQPDAALRCFHRTLELGYADDIDLMLQVGRTLFREASVREERRLFEEARHFFDVATEQAPEMAEAVACVGYVLHRLGDDDGAVKQLRRALQLDGDHTEARIYLANILYDRGEFEAALYHFERTSPDDHWDELGLWRLIELKRSTYKLDDEDPELRPWDERLTELSSGVDEVDELLMELEPARHDSALEREAEVARGQLELFGTLLNGLADQKREGEADGQRSSEHSIMMRDGRQYAGSWDDIVRRMRDADNAYADRTVEEYMRRTATRCYSETGVRIPSHDAESFIRAIAHAGLLRIVR